jgi:two-component system, NarL family, sensor kinase
METVVIFMGIAGTVILLLFVGFCLYLMSNIKSQRDRHEEEKNVLKDRFRQEILKTELEIKEHTMMNISREIHDNIGQVLSLAHLQLTALEIDEADPAGARIDKCMKLLNRVNQDLRDLSKTLNPENVERLGLKECIRIDLDYIERSGVYAVSFASDGQEKKLENSVELVIYRITQQVFNNIIRHSKATHITVGMYYGEQDMLLKIADNGIGFDPVPVQAGSGKGAGLKNMSSRAALINARLLINSGPGQGTSLQLRVPY